METSTDSTQAGDRQAEIAYESIAPVYDDFTAHHNFDEWVEMLLELGEANGLRGDTALDVACGTGRSFLPLLERGWTVTASDISPSMVELARAKATATARIEVADMRELPVFGSFDLVCCLDDAINYLLSAAELEQALRSMAANLAPEGLLIFDSNTMETYRGFFGEHVEVEMNGRRMIWDGKTGGKVEPGQISEAAFEVEPLMPGTGPMIPPELHRQRHHPEAEVRAAITAAGLELADLWGHHQDGIPHQPMSEERHTKAIYLARHRRAR
ncbi:MAG TPA: class I SAM-dependent methyltransferase [Solirubrobacterales bacterium]|jgi:SAM-dependent methyltransferase|nr:class I SAM-dependent methyltransferase [Solirubrobacterales bacterium]